MGVRAWSPSPAKSEVGGDGRTIMEQLTKKQALLNTAELWDWLSKNPEKGKEGWPRWEEFGLVLSQCFLCEYARQQNTVSTCYLCPLRDHWGHTQCCRNEGSPFVGWCDATTLHSKSRYAKQIADLCRKRLLELEAEESDPTLIERQAEFIYNAARLAAIAAQAPVIPVPWVEREQPFRDQFLKVIARQCGAQRLQSPEELHGSWMQAYFAMGWVYSGKYDREAKTHPDLVPYAQLGQLERDKDSVFIALCEIARLFIYDENHGIADALQGAELRPGGAPWS